MRAGNNICTRATTSATWEGCFFTNTPNFNARATTSASGRQHPHARGRQRMRAGDNACVWATTHTRGRQRLRPCDDGCRVGGVFFHKHPKLQRSGDDVYVQATTPASGRRRLHSRHDVLVLVSKRSHFFVLWQSKQNFSIISS